MRRVTTRLAITLLTFGLGVAATGLWAFRPPHAEEASTHALVAGEAKAPPAASGEWTRVDVEGKVSFSLPPGMKEMHGDYTPKINGIYKRVGPTEQHFLYLNYAYGKRAACDTDDDFPGKELSQKSEVLIGGKKARLNIWQSRDKYSSSYSALPAMTLCFPSLSGGKARLHFHVIAFNLEYLKAAQQIFDTIEFH